MGQHGRHVRGQEGLALPQAHDERHVHAGAHDAVGLALVDDRERIRAVGPLQGRAHGRREVTLVGLLDQVGDGLGVGLGAEDVTGRLELVAQLDEVLDDAVVDDRQLAGAVDVRVGVEVVGAAVRRPARVAQAGGRGRASRPRARRAASASLPARFLTKSSPVSVTSAMPAES